MLTCKVCGYQHEMMISPTHLKKHGLNGEEYRKLFPGEVLRVQTEESKRKMSESKKGKETWNKGVKTGQNPKISAAVAGKPRPHLRGLKRTEAQKKKIAERTKEAMKTAMTADVRQKISASIKARQENGTFVPSMLGKKLSDQAKMKIKETLKKTNDTKSLAIVEEFMKTAENDNVKVESVENNYWFNMHCQTCGSRFTFSRQVFRPSTKNGKNICPTCHPRNSGRSDLEQEFFNFVKSIIPSAIANDRTTLGGKEIDVLVKEQQIGFEFTGLYWHSEAQNSEKRHLLWKQQFAHTAGIRLITIFEDEWLQKQDIVKSRVSGMLGKFSRVFAARDCVLKEVDHKTKKDFLIQNHIQGNDSASLSLGLFHGDVLVALGTFKKTNMIKGGDGSSWELSRFCTLLNCRVQGGASKIVKNFITQYGEGLPLISYADRRWSSGNLYKSLGFKFVAETPPSYWYLSNGYSKRVHRSALMKHRLVKCEEDKKLTEWQLAQREGYDRIWDCGTTKWILEK
jgi:hypothetical protein